MQNRSRADCRFPTADRTAALALQHPHCCSHRTRPSDGGGLFRPKRVIVPKPCDGSRITLFGDRHTFRSEKPPLVGRCPSPRTAYFNTPVSSPQHKRVLEHLSRDGIRSCSGGYLVPARTLANPKCLFNTPHVCRQAVRHASLTEFCSFEARPPHPPHPPASSARALERAVLGSWGQTTRGAGRNKERWKGRRAPAQDPST